MLYVNCISTEKSQGWWNLFRSQTVFGWKNSTKFIYLNNKLITIFGVLETWDNSFGEEDYCHQKS